MEQTTYDNHLAIFLQAAMAERTEFENRFYKYPCLTEDTANSYFDTHYVYHVAWAIRKVKELNPEFHVDFSSSVHFCTAAAAICKTVFYDYRPATITLDGLECLQCDLSATEFNIGPFPSVSSMHVVEHIGMGRYGDPLDVNGDLKAITNLKKSVASGGDLLFVVPCGKPSIQFNAHRIYSAEIVSKYFADQFELVEFYFIPGTMTEAPMLNPDWDLTLNYNYGCGCFYFKKMQDVI